MITKYTRPAENPYIPQPWDVVGRTISSNQNQLVANEGLRQKYGMQAEDQKTEYDMMNLQRKEKYQTAALGDMEEGNMILSSLKAYGDADKAKLNEIRSGYMSYLQSSVEKYSDNPFKLAAATRALKNRVKSDIMGGDLYEIQSRYAQAEDMKKAYQKGRLAGYYDNDYYNAALTDLTNPIERTPDLMNEAIGIAKSIAEKGDMVHDEKAMAQAIKEALYYSHPKDAEIRIKGGRKPEDVRKMYDDIAVNAARLQRTNLGLSGRGSSGTSATSSMQMPGGPGGYQDSYVDPEAGPMNYYGNMQEKVSDRTNLDDIYSRNPNAFMFIDKETGELINGKDIYDDNVDSKNNFKVEFISKIDPSTNPFGKFGLNFRDANEVRIGKKTYIASGLSQGDPKSLNDMLFLDNTSFTQAKGQPMKAVKFNSKVLRGAPVTLSYNNAVGYVMDYNGKIYSGQTPQEIYNKILK